MNPLEHLSKELKHKEKNPSNLRLLEWWAPRSGPKHLLIGAEVSLADPEMMWLQQLPQNVWNYFISHYVFQACFCYFDFLNYFVSNLKEMPGFVFCLVLIELADTTEKMLVGDWIGRFIHFWIKKEINKTFKG